MIQVKIVHILLLILVNTNKVTHEEAMEWFKKQYDGIILEKAK